MDSVSHMLPRGEIKHVIYLPSGLLVCDFLGSCHSFLGDSDHLARFVGGSDASMLEVDLGSSCSRIAV